MRSRYGAGMRKTHFAVTAAATLTLALAGCGGGTSNSKPEEELADPTEAATTAAEDTKADMGNDNGFGTYEVADGGTVYTLDLTKPFDYTSDLIDRTNKLMLKAINTVDADEDDQLTEDQAKDIFQWSTLEIDNTQGAAEGTASMVSIQAVGEEMQYDIITEASMFFNEMTEEYQDIDNLTTDEYNEVVEIGNEWLDQDMDAKPGVKLEVPVIITDMPETIESVWFDDMEMQLKK